MEIKHYREPSESGTTYGCVRIDGRFECYTLEDQIREVPGVSVGHWKVQNKTAIPARKYRVELVDSPKFGPDTLTLMDVPGFTDIRVHSVGNATHTSGCIGVGDKRHPDASPPGLSGGLSRGARDRLRDRVASAIKAGEHVTWEIVNP